VSGETRTWKAKLYDMLVAAKKPLMFAGLLAVGVQAYPDANALWAQVTGSRILRRSSSLDRRGDESHYVKRRALESRLADVVEVNSHIGGPYTVVYGHYCTGKSELVDHYAMNATKDVVKVLVFCTNPSSSVLSSLSRELLGSVPSSREIEALQAAVSKSTTVIFEVEGGGDEGKVLPAVQRLAKALGQYCRCIVVLSGDCANAVATFHQDTCLEQYLYVGEMTNDEAKQLVQRLLEREEFKADGREAFEFSDEELQYVFDTIGTNPMMLKRMVGDVAWSGSMTLKEFVGYHLRHAQATLMAFPHQQILKALKEHPEGVSPMYFHGKESEGVHLADPKAVATSLKNGHNVIVYRVELRQYQLISTAHKTALKSYDPILCEWAEL
jgi:hypothetical protein